MAEKKETTLFPPVLPDIGDWPLAKMRKRKKAFVADVVKTTLQQLLAENPEPDKLEEEIAEAMFMEKNRMKFKPWPVDPKDELDFWNGVEATLADLPTKNLSNETKYYKLSLLLEDIILRYAQEIVGDFKPGVYQFAKRLIPHGFATLLNRKSIVIPKSILPKLHLEDKIQFHGAIEAVRNLSTKGTIVMVPTHSSNLDSILMGWGIQEIGLPAFHYGAGLNLFTVRILGWFMERLGAYKVDRRKKNHIYLETLKHYSALSIRDGVHSLFFPGGTRSRSGAIEQHLKLGLLSTAIQAQRYHVEANPETPQKIFIVPVVINYHFVLEAPSLIDDYLKSAGKERYYNEKDELSTSYKVFKLLARLLTRSSQIALSFGTPMDVFGHTVDEAGNSLGKNGKPINISGYFMRSGHIEADKQREQEYTRMLAQYIAKAYTKTALLFSSQLISFVAFELWRKQYNKLDIYEFLRLPVKELRLPYDEFRKKAFTIQQHLKEKQAEGQLDLPPHMFADIDKVLQHGLYHLGQFHARRALKRHKQGYLQTEDLKLLYFYHNRMTVYGLESYI